MSARRVAKSRVTSSGTPSASADPFVTGPKETPRFDQPGTKGGLVDEASGAGMEVEQTAFGGRPAAVVAAHGVGHEDVGVELRVARPRRRCRKPAATNPPAPIRRKPLAPRRAMVAWRSRYPRASTTAPSWDRRTAFEMSGSESPHNTLTDFGAEKVRSNPVTRAAPTGRLVRRWPPVGENPATKGPRGLAGREGLGVTRDIVKNLAQHFGDRTVCRLDSVGVNTERHSWVGMAQPVGHCPDVMTLSD
jgi:hypothetical protein